MSLPGHRASGSVKLHAIPSERGEMEAFLLEEEKFLVADTSRSSEKPHDYVRPRVSGSWLWLGVGEQSWGRTRQFGEIP